MNTPTKEEIAAAFTQAFDGLIPADTKSTALAERLEAYRDAIIAKRAAGFSWKQIAQAMKHPAVNVKVSYATLRTLFGEKAKKRGKKATRTSGGNPDLSTQASASARAK